jgi:hypothetical protein
MGSIGLFTYDIIGLQSSRRVPIRQKANRVSPTGFLTEGTITLKCPESGHLSKTRIYRQLNSSFTFLAALRQRVWL